MPVSFKFIFFLVLLLVAAFPASPGEQPRKPGLIISGKHSRFEGEPDRPERQKQSVQTSLSVTPAEGAALGPDYGMGFDFSIWYPKNFSDLFDLSNNVYSLTLRYLYHPDSTNIHIQLRVNSKHLLFSYVRPLGAFTEAISHNFRIFVDENRGFIEASFDGETKRASSKYIGRAGNSTIYFGLIPGNPENPDMILHNLTLFRDGKVSNKWPFTEVDGNVAFDSVGGMHSAVRNPGWSLATYYNWSRIFRPDHEKLKDVTSFYRLNTFDRKAVLERKPGGEPVGNVFPLEADSVELESVLFDTTLQRLYVQLAVYQKDKCSRYSYFINTPTMTDIQYNSFLAATPVIEQEGGVRFLFVVGMVVVVLVIPGMIWFVISKKQKVFAEKPEPPAETGGRVVTQTDRVNIITVFGGLKIIDANGSDLRTELPPKAQEFLSAVLFYCAFDENNSVPVKKLDVKLWPDFTDSKVKIKNNRNVTSSKVRRTLEKLGAVRIETDRERLTLIVEPPVRNEVKEFANLLSLFNVKAKIEVDHLFSKFIAIIHGGTLFQGLHTDWAEEERFRIAGRIVEILLMRCQYLYKKNDYDNCEETSRLVDLFEPANDQAYYYRIKSLYYLGRHTLVEEVWQKFLVDYKTYSGTDYPGTIKSILKD